MGWWKLTVAGRGTIHTLPWTNKWGIHIFYLQSDLLWREAQCVGVLLASTERGYHLDHHQLLFCGCAGDLERSPSQKSIERWVRA